ncbi:hypothetical protein [Alteribacter populi]|uniref:hypothetical protein n=1 Tax=Alteribacter populi TaxID=2011011 RepID=UPI000BBAB61D|nr:hypothetical protein [Alteribacter populi]
MRLIKSFYTKHCIQTSAFLVYSEINFDKCIHYSLAKEEIVLVSSNDSPEHFDEYKKNNAGHYKERIHSKKAYFITAANDEPVHEVSAPLIKQFELICHYIGLEFISSMVGKGSRPGDVKNDNKAMANC